MKRTILRNIFVSVGAIFALTQLLAAGTSDGKGLAGAGNALPATVIVVTNTNDSGPGSLRDAVAAASDGDTIDATGVSGTILLTSGGLQINHNVTINGPGAGNLAVNGQGTFGVFTNLASNVTISGFTITKGGPYWGAIHNFGGLTLSDSIITDSVASFGGGGIYSNGTLTVMNSTISGNSVTGVGGFGSGFGGGISSFGGTVTVINSTISNNKATCRGGGINMNGSFGQLTVTNSTISGNFTGSGSECEGGLIAGGGIYFLGAMLTVTNSTISGNLAFTGGSLFNDSGGTAQIGDTILNAGASGGTIANSGTFISLGYNLASDNGGGVLTGPGDQINTNPMLGPLQNNGGLTFTHALLPGSPAINAGGPIFTTPPPRYDQRGFARIVHGRIDIGSFEVQQQH
jgi:hypothetical protein